ncbi:hypothetical protein [Sulfurirhabdus autotrophica]|uniref:Uncharacterized protein n=1 Tax=Sulfurirhabdus autotrophica TaxID=1706046 RepID=A0A4R3XYZ7_9PROT|nr:hypothetical protein [Sulfurirhabdus autotrophica]TCV84337.1 hypothetical protein EDC63_112102 [Sulfurirhabdus autotrophica]
MDILRVGLSLVCLTRLHTGVSRWHGKPNGGENDRYEYYCNNWAMPLISWVIAFKVEYSIDSVAEYVRHAFSK